MSSSIPRILQIFKSFDFFSVPFQPAISDNQVFYHKSYIGACTSLILMTVSIIYGIQQLILWQNWQLVPKVTQQQILLSDEELKLKSTLSITAKSQGLHYNESTEQYISIDPFDPQNIILLPLVLKIADDWSLAVNYIQYNNNGTLKLDLTVIGFDEIQVFFIGCDTQYLVEGQKCASQELVDLFFSQIYNEIYFKVKLSQINPDSFQEQIFYRNYGILIDQTFCTTENLYLQKAKYDMDFNFFFESPTYKYLYSYATDQIQISTLERCSKGYLPQTYGILWIVQEDNTVLIKMRYPKVGEVFANIGSIISFLFLIKYVIIAMNFSEMKNQILDKIADSYFNDLANCEISKTWYGKIKSITLKGQEIEQRSYHMFRKNLREHFGCKLNYFNLIYEVSRIQMILCSLQTKKQLLMSHLVGIPMQLKQDQKQKLYKINNIQKQTQRFGTFNNEMEEEQVYVLTSQDANILSYQQKQYCQDEQNQIKSNQQQDYGFYDLNKIPFITSQRIDGTQKL